MHLLCFPWMDRTASESPSPLDICVHKGVEEPLASLTLCTRGEVPNNPDWVRRHCFPQQSLYLSPQGRIYISPLLSFRRQHSKARTAMFPE